MVLNFTILVYFYSWLVWYCCCYSSLFFLCVALQIEFERTLFWASELAQWVKVIVATKSDDLGLIPGTHMSSDKHPSITLCFLIVDIV